MVVPSEEAKLYLSEEGRGSSQVEVFLKTTFRRRCIVHFHTEDRKLRVEAEVIAG